MKIAISTDGGNVSEHFGRCPKFTIVDIRVGKVVSKEEIDNPGHHPGYLPEYFKGMGVERIVAGGMGQRAAMLFEQFGIGAVLGVNGSVEHVIDAITRGEIKGSGSLCEPGSGRGYGVDKTECDHEE